MPAFGSSSVFAVHFEAESRKALKLERARASKSLRQPGLPWPPFCPSPELHNFATFGGGAMGGLLAAARPFRCVNCALAGSSSPSVFLATHFMAARQGEVKKGHTRKHTHTRASFFAAHSNSTSAGLLSGPVPQNVPTRRHNVKNPHLDQAWPFATPQKKGDLLSRRSTKDCFRSRLPASNLKRTRSGPTCDNLTSAAMYCLCLLLDLRIHAEVRPTLCASG